MDKIRILPINLINQIAAGEVIERPSSIIKELVENSIDAGARSITITIRDGGITFLVVKDDGLGMTKNDLAMCLLPHATSKLNEDNLNRIATLGFRGEALASIGSIAKILVSSKGAKEDGGYEVYAENGKIDSVKPSGIKKGTVVKVTDLFFSVPARLKFLRTSSVEAGHCYSIIKRLALANPHISFKVESNDKIVFSYVGCGNDEDLALRSKESILKNRVAEILGSEFLSNAVFIDGKNPKLRLYGFIGVPTYNKNHGNDQFFIVNKRSLKDKFLSGVVKIGYGDTLVYGRHPCYVLFLDMMEDEIDVNVNPTKSEVRFRDIAFVRHILLSAIRNSLQEYGSQNNSSLIGSSLMQKSLQRNSGMSMSNIQQGFALKNDNEVLGDYFSNLKNVEGDISKDSAINYVNVSEEDESLHDSVLGFAKAQYHKNWIIAQDKDGLVVVDQHAAHERVTHEELKDQFENRGIVTQILLISEFIELTAEDLITLETYKDHVNKLGIIFDFFSGNVVLIKEIPAILGNPDVKTLIKELIADLRELEAPSSFNKKINDILARIACHGSIRAGRTLSIKEMNDLLRVMERTKNYGQCSHGRPTFIRISLKDLEKFFGR